jgi:transcriptional regulator CtsR
LKKEEVTLVMLDSSKMMTESKKISDIIKNNIKRLGPSSSMTGLTQQKNNLADHLQAISSYLLNLHLNQEKTILQTFNRSSD